MWSSVTTILLCLHSGLTTPPSRHQSLSAPLTQAGSPYVESLRQSLSATQADRKAAFDQVLKALADSAPTGFESFITGPRKSALDADRDMLHGAIAFTEAYDAKLPKDVCFRDLPAHFNIGVGRETDQYELFAARLLWKVGIGEKGSSLPLHAETIGDANLMFQELFTQVKSVFNPTAWEQQPGLGATKTFSAALPGKDSMQVERGGPDSIVQDSDGKSWIPFTIIFLHNHKTRL